jgi:integrase/recombinase XerC
MDTMIANELSPAREVIINRFATENECLRFAEFQEFLSLRGRAASTARSYRSDWESLSRYARRHAGAAFDSAALDAEMVESWRDAALARGKSAATVTRRLAFVRIYGDWLADGMVITDQMARSIRDVPTVHKAERTPRVLADKQTHLLLAHVAERACPRDQALVHVLIDSGLKVSEVAKLNVGDVDFERGRLIVRGTRRRDVPMPTRTARKVALSLAERGLIEVPESGELVLPATGGWPPSDRLPPPRAEQLPQLMRVPSSPMPLGVRGAPSEWPLFVGERGRLTANAIQRVVRKHTTFARIDASPQVLRHTFAFNHWVQHNDLVALAEVLGHENVETTRVYTHIEPPEDGDELVVDAEEVGLA